VYFPVVFVVFFRLPYCSMLVFTCTFWWAQLPDFSKWIDEVLCYF